MPRLGLQTYMLATQYQNAAHSALACPCIIAMVVTLLVGAASDCIYLLLWGLLLGNVILS